MIALALLVEAALVQALPPARTCAVRTASNEMVELVDVPRDRYAVEDAATAGGVRLVTVFATQHGKLPVAVGFCEEPLSNAATHGGAVGNRVAALDSRRADSCAVTDTTGRTALVEYAPFDGGEARFSSAGGWPWTARAGVSRSEAGISKARVRITRLGGRKGISGTEYFYVSGPDAANLVLFDRVSAGAAGQAAMICSYSNVTRGPAPR